VQSEIGALFERFDFVMLPCAPVSRLRAGDDHGAVRPRILRYTAPFSMAGLPVVALPGEMIGAGLGTGMLIAAAPGRDAELLAYAGTLAQRIVDEAA
jgi:Asp-tRNA(Asn)/Glu-tRNA(Gln) amidotransferase A subunit family amidase